MTDEPANESGESPIEHMSFEEAHRLLEETVRALEDPDVALDDAIALYERGVRLADRCQALLETAEQRIRQVMPARTDN